MYQVPETLVLCWPRGREEFVAGYLWVMFGGGSDAVIVTFACPVPSAAITVKLKYCAPYVSGIFPLVNANLWSVG